MILVPRQEVPRLGLLASALTLFGVAIVVSGVAGVSRDLERTALMLVAIAGALVGWWLASTRLGGFSALLISIGLGLALLFTLVGGLAPRIGAIAVNLTERVPELAGGEQVEWPRVGEAVDDLRLSTSVLIERQISWLRSWISGTPLYDPVATSLVWSAGLWMVAGWAGWWVRRHDHVIVGLLPASILLISTLGYHGAGTGAVLALLALALILMATVDLTGRHRTWALRQTRYSQQIWRGGLLWVTVIALGLMAVAAVGQNFSLREGLFAKRYATEDELDERESVADALGLRSDFLRQSDALIDTRHNPGLPQRHLVGSGPELSEEIVMRVSDLQGAGRGYHRSVTFDRYTGGGWQTSWAPPTGYSAGTVLPIVPGNNSRLIHQRIEVVGEPDGIIYSSGELITADQDFVVEWRGPTDPFGAALASTSRAYEVESLVVEASEEELRAAGQEYPEWILQDYFALPASVPARVLQLGRRITAGEPTPYDRAKAIEAYLRSFEYTLAVPPPPAGRDIAEYFLFDLQRGYCDYYATSMVVLARSAGLPARLVSGYIGGELDPESGASIVSKAEAHSWVEVYFPEIGWVEFEPTAGRSPIVRDQEIVVERPAPQSSQIRADVVRGNQRRVGGILGFAMLALVSVPLLALAVEQIRFITVSPGRAVDRAYAYMCRLARRLGYELGSGETPRERSESLRRQIADQLPERWSGAALDRLALIAGTYEQISYRPDREAPSPTETLTVWRGLRWRMWMAWVTNRLVRGLGRYNRALGQTQLRSTE